MGDAPDRAFVSDERRLLSMRTRLSRSRVTKV